MKEGVGISSVLPEYPHIHMLNDYSFPKDKSTVFKYMPLDRLVNSIKNDELVFVSPAAWYDPFEQLYHGIDCSSRGYITEDIACMCVSEKSSTNEDASWRVYAGSSNKSVRVSIDQTTLLSLLEDYASTNGFEVYIGKVDYSYDKKVIKSLHIPTSVGHSSYFPNLMNREHYLSVMLLKRKAFQYENEVRIFLVKEKINFKNNLLCVPCRYKKSHIISNVMLSPYPPVRVNGDIAYKVRNKINDIESKEYKKRLGDMLGCQIQQSMLYKVYTRIKSI